jgi:hypothetical protein
MLAYLLKFVGSVKKKERKKNAEVILWLKRSACIDLHASICRSHPLVVCKCEHYNSTKVGTREICMIHVPEEIKLLKLPSLLMTSRMAIVGRTCPRKQIRGSASCIVTWNTWRFSMGYYSVLVWDYTLVRRCTPRRRSKQFSGKIKWKK